jgi:two-component system, cell cycle sensor histidine kinase and response regulator CckA
VSTDLPPPDRPPSPVPRDGLIESIRPYPRASENGTHAPADGESERILLRLQRLETLGRLTSEIAHDYGDLMTVIVGYCELLASPKPLVLPGRTYQEEMRDAVDRALELTRQLLGFCRLTAEARTGPVDLAAVVKTSVEMLERLLKRTIPWEIDDARAAHIQADARDVELVVVNLVLNACDATAPHNGRVEVSLTPVNLDAPLTDAVGTAPPGHYNRLRVWDNGCGIDDLTRGRLFKPFFTTKPGGTGLGLAVAARIVRHSHAAMTVRSDPAEGTTFDVYFPTAG